MDNIIPGQYTDWSKADLLTRLSTIETAYLKSRHTNELLPTYPKYPYPSHPRRKIAVKFCYSGWVYGGLAAQSDTTPLPTVEQVLFDALVKARLIDPDAGFDGCGWDRCGRTDKGVSAAGQVVSLWVRSAIGSNAKNEKQKDPNSSQSTEPDVLDDILPCLEEADFGTSPSSIICQDEHPPDLPYVSLINRTLPSTIRVIAWSPVRDSFSARFDCESRHYKYFFSAANLSIPLIREAASFLIGKHDFRNLCKIDPAKQIKDYRRRVYRADIVPAPDEINGGGKIWVFNLVGRGFLYHQVRHIMAVLLLIGAELEKPLLLKQLMHVDTFPSRDLYPDEQLKGDDDPISEEEDTLRAEDGYLPLRNKPEYQMTDALPLLLWDCSFSDSVVSWRRDYVPQPENVPAKYREVVHGSEPSAQVSSPGGVTLNGGAAPRLSTELSAIIERNLIELALNAHFLYAVQLSGLYGSSPIFHPTSPPPTSITSRTRIPAPDPRSQTFNVPLGGGTSQRLSNYVPLMARHRMASVEETNERWLKTKGAKRIEKGAKVPERGEVEGPTLAP